MASHHEPTELLDEGTLDTARALHSLREEIEAIDWYNQRVAASKDPELKRVLAHNRDEEIEHACMVLEWLRRNMDGWDHELRTYLFTETDITEAESSGGGEAEDPARTERGAGLGIGDLKHGRAK